MAIGTATSLGVAERVKVVVPCTVAAGTVVANSDVTALTTFGTVGNYTTITGGGGICWVKVAQGVTRVKLRGRFPVASTVTTKPVVKLIGAASVGEIALSSNAITSGSASFTRLDNVTSQVAAGLTVNLVAAGTTAGTDDVLRDDTYAYSDWLTNPLTGDVWFDLHGCQYVCVPVFTAAVISAGVVGIEMVGVN